jgi:hypothetical protein
MSSGVETSLIVRTKKIHVAGLLAFALAASLIVSAQEPVTPSPPSTASPTPDVLPTSTESPTPSVMPSPTATAIPARNIRISFLPPPLDGTISLGIYNAEGKLVRVLHRQAKLDEFTVGPDALVTKWDGKDDEGRDLPAGKYSAHGYLVGGLQIEKLDADAAAAPTPGENEKVKIKLMTNPLVKNERPTIELTVGFDAKTSFLKTGDDLPLYTISEQTNVTRASAVKNGDKSIEVWQDDQAGTEHFRISRLDKMMAFDCGGFELK